ncbi:MAG: DUF402 domain-containing protein [Actinobacteria bacterium]|nr:DUF402 domain-containing protein [Actinomycetota bacterium]
MTEQNWRPGQTIVLQDVWDGKLWSARPMKVVEDSGGRIILWKPKGTRWKVPVTPPVRPKADNRGERVAQLMIHRDWLFEDREWDVSTLWIIEEGRGCAILASWFDDSKFWGWYVNLQEQYSRKATTLQTMDLALDILIDSDRSWRWKDEDELKALVTEGAIDQRKADQIRAEGLAAIADLENNAPPFSEPWDQWKPDPDWEAPVLPEDWERLE